MRQSHASEVALQDELASGGVRMHWSPWLGGSTAGDGLEDRQDAPASSLSIRRFA